MKLLSTKRYGSKTISKEISGFDEEFLPASEEHYQSFQAPEGHDDDTETAVDVLINVMRGPYRNGEVIDENMLEDVTHARIVPSSPATAPGNANFIVRQCSKEYAFHIQDLLSRIEGLAPNDVTAAVRALLSDGEFDYRKDDGHTGIEFYSGLEAKFDEKHPKPKVLAA